MSASTDGIGIRTQVMGAAFVEQAMISTTDFNQPLQEFIDAHAWGSVWSRDGISLKARSLVTLAVLTVLKKPAELAGNVRGGINNRCTIEEIHEVFLHCAVFAGVPASTEAFRAAKSVIDEIERQPVYVFGSNRFGLLRRLAVAPYLTIISPKLLILEFSACNSLIK